MLDQILKKKWTFKVDSHRVLTGDLGRDGGPGYVHVASVQYEDDFGAVHTLPMMTTAQTVDNYGRPASMEAPMHPELVRHLVDLHNKSIKK
jgi:hypothetical protein